MLWSLQYLSARVYKVPGIALRKQEEEEGLRTPALCVLCCGVLCRAKVCRMCYAVLPVHGPVLCTAAVPCGPLLRCCAALGCAVTM